MITHHFGAKWTCVYNDHFSWLIDLCSTLTFIALVMIKNEHRIIAWQYVYVEVAYVKSSITKEQNYVINWQVSQTKM